MAIKIESYSVIIPRVIIDPVYPGGSDALIVESEIPAEFYDENLISYGASDSIEIERIIGEWTNRGLRDIRKRKGKRVWIDLCLVDSEEGPTLPCKWIKFNNGIAEYKISG